MNKKPNLRAFSLALALLLLCSVLPPRARAAEDGNPYASSSVAAVIVSPATDTGHVRFGAAADVGELAMRGEDGIDVPVTPVLSVADALNKACQDAFGGAETMVKDSLKLDYIASVSVPAAQGTLYDGFNNEGDTGAGVAGIQKYYYGDAASNYRISNIRFVPKTSFNGQASIDYYGYYTYKEEETIMIGDVESKREITRTGSYAGRLYITVGKQEPGISYSTDGEPAQFSAEDFTAYSSAVTGRSFKYVTFRLPSASVGALYYNYISESIYDYPVAQAQRFYPTGTQNVNHVFFVPVKDYAGEVRIEFSGVDSAEKAFSGEVVIHVTNTGPGHSQPSAEGPFVYRVAAGRSVNLTVAPFEEQVALQLGSGEKFYYFSLASLPPSDSGTLYYDAYSSGSSHVVAVGRSYDLPAEMRFAASVGYSGIVSVPIVITAESGKSFDSMLRFVVTDEGDSPLRYTVEPERRVNLVASDFSDACYRATGYGLNYLVFDTVPASSTGSLYYLDNTPVARTSGRYSLSQLSDVSFLANAGFTGEVSFTFTGYALGYTNRNDRSFRGTVTIVSTAVPQQTPSIGSTGGPMQYQTWGPAVSLNYLDIYRAAVSSLPGAPATLSLSRPEYGTGQLCFDFVSLSNYTPFDATRAYPLTDAGRISYLPKAGFSGTTQISCTVRDASGNSYTANIRFTVTPPTYSTYYSDMGETSWAVQAVDFFSMYGATNGNSGTGFGPSAAMRRGDFLLLLQRLFVFPAAGTSSYSDVPADKYYAAAVSGAKALGIVTDADVRASTGSASRFNPEGAITRQDAALYLYRALRRAGKIQPGSAADLARFPDARNVSAAAVEAMGALVRDGVFQGYVSNLLPQRTLSRAETMAILYRAFT